MGVFHSSTLWDISDICMEYIATYGSAGIGVLFGVFVFVFLNGVIFALVCQLRLYFLADVVE